MPCLDRTMPGSVGHTGLKPRLSGEIRVFGTPRSANGGRRSSRNIFQGGAESLSSSQFADALSPQARDGPAASLTLGVSLSSILLQLVGQRPGGNPELRGSCGLSSTAAAKSLQHHETLDLVQPAVQEFGW